MKLKSNEVLVEEIASIPKIRTFLDDLDVEIGRAVDVSNQCGIHGEADSQTAIAHYVDGLRFAQRKLSSILR